MFSQLSHTEDITDLDKLNLVHICFALGHKLFCSNNTASQRKHCSLQMTENNFLTNFTKAVSEFEILSVVLTTDYHFLELEIKTR